MPVTHAEMTVFADRLQIGGQGVAEGVRAVEPIVAPFLSRDRSAAAVLFATSGKTYLLSIAVARLSTVAARMAASTYMLGWSGGGPPNWA